MPWRPRRPGASSHTATARQRGYNTEWQRRRADYIRRHPICGSCGKPATVADHQPSLATLRARGVPDPHADRYLNPLCARCHGRKTVSQDGGLGPF